MHRARSRAEGSATLALLAIDRSCCIVGQLYGAARLVILAQFCGWFLKCIPNPTQPGEVLTVVLTHPPCQPLTHPPCQLHCHPLTRIYRAGSQRSCRCRPVSMSERSCRRPMQRTGTRAEPGTALAFDTASRGAPELVWCGLRFGRITSTSVVKFYF